MNYDKRSFLAGIAVGRQAKGWASVETGQGDVSYDTIIDALYSEFGTAADLIVDELRTDYQKAWFYLAGCTDNIDYIHIYNENIDLITGSVRRSDPSDPASTPLTEQLHHTVCIPGSWDNIQKQWQYTTRYFWWTDGTHSQMTSLQNTGLPVTVYQYDELTMSTFRFNEVTEAGITSKIPQLIFGAGYGQPGHPERGKGFLCKNSYSFDLLFTDSAGTDRGVSIGEYYTDIIGLRKPTELDFSGWGGGTFSETLDGGEVSAWTIEFEDDDPTKPPVKFTDGDGHETAVVWE